MTAGASRLKQLLIAAKQGSREKRGDFLREIAEIFLAAPNKFTASELQHFDAIMSLVAGQAEVGARQELAEKFAGLANPPPMLIRQIAEDEISVARPVLERCKALHEDDLIGIIHRRGLEHRQAIARRRRAPEQVTAELITRADVRVLVALAENRSARLSEQTMEKMVAHARSIKSLQKSMVDRFDLPPSLLTKMYFFVTTELKREILKRSDRLDPALITEVIKANRRKILLQTPQLLEPDIAAAREFIREKAAADKVNERLLKDLMQMKRPTAFLLAFAHIVGVDMVTAQSLLKDKTWEPLAIACRAAGFEQETFSGIMFSMPNDNIAQAKAHRIADVYPKVPQDAAERMMRFWRVRPPSTTAVAAHDAGARRPKLHEIGQRIGR